MTHSKVFALLGHPVKHSLSPRMHNAAFESLGLDARYFALDIPPDDLERAIGSMRDAEVAGANVTVPHKQHVMPLLDETDALATRVGAVNTIVREGDRVCGRNTDVGGLLKALDEAEAPFGHFLILGAGGAARAALVTAVERGAERVTVAARRPAAARSLCESLQPHLNAALEYEDLNDRSALDARLETTAVLIQATSATLDGAEGEALSDKIDFTRLPASALAVDLVYATEGTAFTRRAEAMARRAIDGKTMLLHQAALAFELWLGIEAPVDVMREALR